ncbi:NACHT domain-containing NTPase [Nostocaceae cyanobacterium CENA357]|uniref:NACHT domain-containing NTPase n=1 Tax=Atlanticothrix silvestris CENA357 TaxID=1725252 RepID=A0A8J7L5F0_9CYAN|nr:NACHT domain-containing NTPase [Atlanticothrix silvestris]MBH8552997.1 NACHT domain-containing NTPase [Atlanticothrix silvestris CENA357]
MAKRSLQASDEGIRKAKQAFKRKGWTQEYLASEVNLETRQPIWKFFTGKPIDRHVFNDICFVLEVDPSEIAQKPGFDEFTSSDTSTSFTLDIDALVQKLRSVHYEKMQAQCGTLHLLDIARPVALKDIYIDVNILEEITSKRWLEISDLQRLDANKLNSCDLSKLSPEKTVGLEIVKKYSHLMVLGKPGSGKTAFLKSIAINCNQEIFQPNYLPIFISLKNFAEEIRCLNQINLSNYLYEYWINFGISEQELINIFAHGRALILLDGLDEVPGKYSKKIIHEIQRFTDRFYKNQIIITSRIASQAYHVQGFTEVEIADFTKPEIARFAEKWFLVVAKNSPVQAKNLANKLMKNLELTENLPILELAGTPIFLNLICLFFKSLKDFPSNHCELYKQALDLLLVRWDEARCVKRDQVYGDFSLLHKIKLLSRIAAVLFTQENNFQREPVMRQFIADYLLHLPNATTDIEILELESVAVLKVIEVQHGLLTEKARGIYAFSHSIFQEYLTAREIISNDQSLKKIVNHINEYRWRNIYLLSVGMLKPADTLLQLMKEKIDSLAATNVRLSNFLRWVEQKYATVNVFYHAASVRAFYFTIALPPEYPLACNQELAMSLDNRLAGNLAVDLALDLALIHVLVVSLGINADIFLQRFSALSFALDLKHLLTEQPYLQKSLQDLKSQLPFPSQGGEVLKIWWQDHGNAWIKELRTLMIDTRQIGHNWQFNQHELEQLQQYWDANKLLVDCLNRASDVTPQMRNFIEKNLFLVCS